MLVRLFSVPACDNPFQGPFLGRPILGASNHFYSGLFANFVDYLIAGVRKTRETLQRHLFYQKFSNKNNKYLGGIKWQQRQNTTYTYISEW